MQRRSMICGILRAYQIEKGRRAMRLKDKGQTGEKKGRNLSSGARGKGGMGGRYLQLWMPTGSIPQSRFFYFVFFFVK